MPKKRTSAAKSPADSAPRGSAKNLTVSLPELLVDGSDLKFRERVAAEYAILLATWHPQKTGILDKQSHPKDSRAVLIRLTADEMPNSIHLAKSFHPRTPVREERRRKTAAKESRQ